MLAVIRVEIFILAFHLIRCLSDAKLQEEYEQGKEEEEEYKFKINVFLKENYA